jgi:hypothetical protein
MSQWLALVELHEVLVTAAVKDAAPTATTPEDESLLAGCLDWHAKGVEFEPALQVRAEFSLVLAGRIASIRHVRSRPVRVARHAVADLGISCDAFWSDVSRTARSEQDDSSSPHLLAHLGQLGLSDADRRAAVDGGDGVLAELLDAQGNAGQADRARANQPSNKRLDFVHGRLSGGHYRAAHQGAADANHEQQDNQKHSHRTNLTTVRSGVVAKRCQVPWQALAGGAL